MLQRGILFATLSTLFACGGAQPTTTIRAWYGGSLYSAAYRELTTPADSNESFSVLYQSDAGLAGGAAFVAVLSDEGAHPVWHEVQVSGNQCAAGELCAVPAQLTSTAQLLAAVGPGADQVHLVTTGTRCSVLDVRPAP